MGYVLGIDLGTSRTAAAVFRDGRATIVPLSDHTATMPSMVFAREDAALLVGEPARRRGHDEPARLAREFKRRFGDTTPLVLGDTSLTAEQLTAALLRHVVDFVSVREGGAPDAVVVAHPANWGAYRRSLLRDEVAAAGLPGALLVTEPDAAAIHHASTERMEVGDVVAVYDLGGGTFDASVLRRTADGFEPVGEPKGIERLGGTDFDDLLFQHVLGLVDLDPERLGEADARAIVRLRDECQAAKEALSDDTATTVPVMVAGLSTTVRVTRGELEQMIRPSIRSSVHCLRTAILDAGLEPSQVSAVLMTGGSSRIPLAAEMIGDDLHIPLVLTSNPKEAVALGAARLGAGAAAVPATPPVPVTSPIAQAPPAPALTSPPTAPVPATPPPMPPPVVPLAGDGHRGRRWLIVAAAAIVVLGGGGLALALTRTDDGGQGASAASDGVTTAVTTAPPASVDGTSTTSSTSTSTSTTSTTSTTTTTTLAPTTVPTTSASPTPANVTVEEALTTLDTYFGLAITRQYTEAFALCTPPYQLAYKGFDNFSSIWNRKSAVGVTAFVSSTPLPSGGQTVVVEAFFEGFNSDHYDERLEIDLVRGDDGVIRLDRYKVLSSAKSSI